jgi:hypothetical protein
MNELKHTPGPWHVGCLGGEGTCQCRNVLDEGYAGGIATIHMSNGIASISEGGNDAPPRDEAIANMRLIAAAPDLLEVARECLELAKLAESLCGCRGDDDYVWGIQEKLNAAIAKAEGRK